MLCDFIDEMVAVGKVWTFQLISSGTVSTVSNSENGSAMVSTASSDSFENAALPSRGNLDIGFDHE